MAMRDVDWKAVYFKGYSEHGPKTNREEGRALAERWENVEVDGQLMRSFVCTPQGEGPHPAVVVIQGAGGVDDFIREMTRRTAIAGYVAIAPDLYHRLDLNADVDMLTKAGNLEDELIMNDVNSAVQFIRSQGLANKNVGIMGFCLGGRVSFMMAGTNPAIKAAVPFYGGNTMVAKGDNLSSFALMPYIRCPVLGFFGEDDRNPSPDDMVKIGSQLTSHGVPHEFHMYSATGHAYMDFNNHQMHREYASESSWLITLAFLEKHLN